MIDTTSKASAERYPGIAFGVKISAKEGLLLEHVIRNAVIKHLEKTDIAAAASVVLDGGGITEFTDRHYLEINGIMEKLVMARLNHDALEGNQSEDEDA